MRSRPKYGRMEEQAVHMSQRSSVVIAKVRLRRRRFPFSVQHFAVVVRIKYGVISLIS